VNIISDRISEAKEKITLAVKGSKKKPYDWIDISKSVNYLKKNSYALSTIAKIAGVSEQTIRQISKLDELTKDNKQRVLENKIKMDAAYRLAGISNKELQNYVGHIIENLNSHDQRDIIQFAKKNQSSSKSQLNQFKEEVIKSKPLFKDINMIIFGLDNEYYDEIRHIAKKENTSISKIVTNIIKEWYKKRKGDRI
jgi:hypothetical protein